MVFLSTCKNMSHADSVEEAEGRAALVGLHALANMYRGRVILETDCKSIADALNSDVTVWSSLPGNATGWPMNLQQRPGMGTIN